MEKKNRLTVDKNRSCILLMSFDHIKTIKGFKASAFIRIKRTKDVFIDFYLFGILKVIK